MERKISCKMKKMLVTYEQNIQDKNGLLEKNCIIANNIYNSCLYFYRKEYFDFINGEKDETKYLSYFELCDKMREKSNNNENCNYHRMSYAQSSNQTIKEVSQVWKSFLNSSKDYKKNPEKYNGKPKIPKYLKKNELHPFHLVGQNCKIKDGYLISKQLELNIKLTNTKIGKIKRVTFIHINSNNYKMLIQHEIDVVKMKEDNGKYVAVDPGLDNLFTCVTNVESVKPMIINGRPLKSINQKYNKEISRLSSEHASHNQCFLEKNIEKNDKCEKKRFYYFSSRQKKLTEKRNNKIKDYAHKASKCVVDYALNCGANTIIIGKNENQKQEINIGKRNNQNFVMIPHAMIIDVIRYKCEKQGINFIITEESYTSQTSYLDNEIPCKENGNQSRKLKGLSPVNRRIERGLFKSDKGILINADVNGAYQIMRKVKPEVKYNGDKSCLAPYKITC